MKITVIGNGATAVDEHGLSHINQHTATFLFDLADTGSKICFIQPREKFCKNANLHDCTLSSVGVESLTIERSQLFPLLRLLPRLLNRIFTADFVYIFYPGTLPKIMAWLCMAIRKPYGIYLRGEQFSSSGRSGKIFRQAKFITTVSESLGQSIGHLNSQIVATRPMLDITAKDAIQQDFQSRIQKPWRLLFVGRLETAKGIPELVEAAHTLEARGFPFTLSLVGGGPLYAGLFSQYGNNPGASIRVLGPIQDRAVLLSEYETADLFVLPTHHEGFPRVLYEAMIKSMVIFTSFVGGIPGLMKNRENCIEIPVQDATAIADAIENTSRDRMLMQHLSENGLATVKTVLSSYPTHFELVKEKLNV